MEEVSTTFVIWFRQLAIGRGPQPATVLSEKATFGNDVETAVQGFAGQQESRFRTKVLVAIQHLKRTLSCTSRALGVRMVD